MPPLGSHCQRLSAVGVGSGVGIGVAVGDSIAVAIVTIAVGVGGMTTTTGVGVSRGPVQFTTMSNKIGKVINLVFVIFKIESIVGFNTKSQTMTLWHCESSVI
jgi:hypothetical protein